MFIAFIGRGGSTIFVVLYDSLNWSELDSNFTMSLVQRLILYLFPLYLTAMEQIIRTIFSSEAFSVSTVSSSISVGGLALLLPYLVPAPFTEGLDLKTLEIIKARRMKVYKTRDQNLAISAWFFLVSLTFVWIFSLSKKADAVEFRLFDVGISLPEIISASIYLVGIVHTELKERDNGY